MFARTGPEPPGAGVEDRETGRGEVKDVVGVEVPKVRPPSRSVALAPACTWEPEMTLSIFAKIWSAYT